jgi:crotonobetainyl-CoA:carnitine CoA-transferase CaiB-like acyl-CoA transferase
MVVDVDHPKLGHVKTFNIPIKFRGITVGVEKGTNPHDPELGEHSSEVLKKYLNKTDAEISPPSRRRYLGLNEVTDGGLTP